MIGQKIRTTEWIHGAECVVRVEVEGVRPADDPDDIYFDASIARHLDQLQKLADEGNVSELAKHGIVYVRQSA